MAVGYLADLTPAEITLSSSVDIDHARSMVNRFYYPIAVGTPDRTTDPDQIVK
jgi:hypothetical protein